MKEGGSVLLTKKSKEFLDVLGNMKNFIHNVKCLELIPHSEFMTLLVIERSLEKCENNQPGIKVTDIAKKLEITKPAASKMLSIIEQKNYIERIADRSDRRVVYIALTDTGKKLLKDANQYMERLTNSVMDAMGEEDSETLIRLLNKLYRIMEEGKNKNK